MCNPTAAMAVQGAGAGMSAVGAIYSALGERDTLKHQARVAEINARIAEGNARNTLRVGQIEESRVKLAGAQAKSKVRTSIASSGITLDSTTALARQTGNDLITEVDAQTVKENALRAAWGQRIEAGNLKRAAASARASAKGIGPGMAGAASLLTSAGQVASSWYGLKQQGAWDKAPKTGNVTFEGSMVETPNPGIVAGDNPYLDNDFGGLLTGWGKSKARTGYGAGY